MWTVRVERCWSDNGEARVHRTEGQAARLSSAATVAMELLRSGIVADTECGKLDGQVMQVALVEVVYEHR